MSIRSKCCASILGLTLCAGVALSPAGAQVQGKQEQHVVTTGELKQESGQPAETRAANEQAIRHLISSDPGEQALKTANVDYQRVDKAISQLNDEELAKLADRSRQAESDFAAGNISAKTLAYIILAIVVIVVIIVIAEKV